jgi:glycosyltransferase involved in cell wall biosynthesis
MSHVLVCTISYDGENAGGGNRLAYDAATGFARDGHRVTVVAEAAHATDPEVSEEEGVRVLRYRVARAPRIAPWRHREHIAAAEKLLRLHMHEPPDSIQGHSVLQFLAALNLYRSRSRSCFVIHSPAVDEMRIVWRAQGWAGTVKSLLGLPLIRRLERRCLTESDALTAESEFTTSMIGSRYGTEIGERIETVPGWVDLERFRPLDEENVKAARYKLGWPLDRPVLFALRRLEPRMGLDNLLRALAEVKRRGHDLYMVIGGRGTQRERLEALRSELGLSESVRFHGFVPGADLPLAYAACDASLIPTAQLECFGLIALEALACGRPTLVTPVGALPEVVSRFEPQWVARENSPESIADIICQYLEGKLPAHPPERLRETIRSTYSFEQFIASHQRVLLADA